MSRLYFTSPDTYEWDEETGTALVTWLDDDDNVIHADVLTHRKHAARPTPDSRRRADIMVRWARSVVWED